MKVFDLLSRDSMATDIMDTEGKGGEPRSDGSGVLLVLLLTIQVLVLMVMVTALMEIGLRIVLAVLSSFNLPTAK